MAELPLTFSQLPALGPQAKQHEGVEGKIGARTMKVANAPTSSPPPVQPKARTRSICGLPRAAESSTLG